MLRKRYDRLPSRPAHRIAVLRHGSAAHQLCFRCGELFIAERALLVQRRDLLQLIGHGEPGRRSSLRRRRLLRRRGLLGLLLLQCADSLVLIGLVRGPLIRFAGLMVARYVGPPPTTAARMSGRRRLNITASYCWMRTVTWRSSASGLSYGRHTERASRGLCSLAFGAEGERLSAGRWPDADCPGSGAPVGSQ